MRRTSGSTRSHETNPPPGAMGGRRDRHPVAVLGRRHRGRLVARRSPPDERRPWTAGRRLPCGESPDARSAIAGDHARCVARPGQRCYVAATARGHAFGSTDPKCVGHGPDADRLRGASDPAHPNAHRSRRDPYAAGAHSAADADPAHAASPAHATSPALTRRFNRSGRAAHSSEISCKMVPVNRSNA